MVKNKKFAVVLIVFMLGAALLSSCSVTDGGESQLEGISESTDYEDGQDYTSDETVESNISDQSETQSQAASTATGILKAAEADSITIIAESGEELVINITSDSKIEIGDVASTSADLATKVGSKVTVSYCHSCI